MKPFFLSRRTVLRGLGVALALPTLDAMLNDRGKFHGVAGAQASTPAPRLITYFFPNGAPPFNNWFVPAAAGPGWEITRCLEPLRPLRSKLTFLSGLAGESDNIDAHQSGICSFSTGVAPTQEGAGGPSVDQIAARHLGKETRFDSLVVACQEPFKATDSNISWAGRNQVAAAERDPAMLFTRVFGDGTPEAAKRIAELAQSRRSVLDAVQRDITRLEARLGAVDRQRLDAYRSALRELERRIDLEGHTACQAPEMPPPTTTGNYAKALVQQELLAMALACNLTRVASFMFCNGANEGGCDDVDVCQGRQQHELEHDGKWEEVAQITTVHMQAAAQFLNKLDSFREGDRTLLDNSVVYIGTELGDGQTHHLGHLPVILAGSAAGALTPGHHLTYDGSTPLRRLHLRLLHMVGAREEQFNGESTLLPMGNVV